MSASLWYRHELLWTSRIPFLDQSGMYCFKFARIFTGKYERLGENAALLRVGALMFAARDDRIIHPAIVLEYWRNRVVRPPQKGLNKRRLLEAPSLRG